MAADRSPPLPSTSFGDGCGGRAGRRAGRDQQLHRPVADRVRDSETIGPTASTLADQGVVVGAGRRYRSRAQVCAIRAIRIPPAPKRALRRRFGEPMRRGSPHARPDAARAADMPTLSWISRARPSQAAHDRTAIAPADDPRRGRAGALGTGAGRWWLFLFSGQRCKISASAWVWPAAPAGKDPRQSPPGQS